MKVEYDPEPVLTGAEIERGYDEADRRYDAEMQAKLDNRLTAEEQAITVGCLAVFITQMRRDMNTNPDKTDEYRRDMRAASSAIAKLQGVGVVSKHTPGPWRVDDYGTSVRKADGALIADAFSAGAEDPDRHEVRRSNARLIAAAPDLLAAARRATSLLWEIASEVEDGVRRLNEDSPEGELWLQLTDAIAKALGEQE